MVEVDQGGPIGDLQSNSARLICRILNRSKGRSTYSISWWDQIHDIVHSTILDRAVICTDLIIITKQNICLGIARVNTYYISFVRISYKCKHLFALKIMEEILIPIVLIRIRKVCQPMSVLSEYALVEIKDSLQVLRYDDI